MIRYTKTMDAELCFICGGKIGRGNRSEIGTQEKMDKLVSVQRTVDTGTIISDILSRILNETVMREESVCRICFNLLNDIDYHLKEAQEKTDEVTAKFIDKEKDPLKYEPYKVATDLRKQQSKRHKCKVVTTSGGRPPNIISRTIQTEFDEVLPKETHSTKSTVYSPVKDGGHHQFKHPESKHAVATESSSQVEIHSNSSAKDQRRISPKKHHSPMKEPETSDEEMTRNKRRLLSRVLAPAKKSRVGISERVEDLDSDDEKRLTIDMEEKILREKRRKEKKQRKKEKRLKRLEKERQMEIMLLDSPVDNDDVKCESSRSVSPHQSYKSTDTSSVPAQPVSPQPQQSKDIRTVDLSQLGDLFSVPVSSSPSADTAIIPAGAVVENISHSSQSIQNGHSSQSSQIFARKSAPATLAEQVQAAPIFILPDQVQPATVANIASRALKPGQDVPIIDCRPLVAAQQAQCNDHGEQKPLTLAQLVQAQAESEEEDDPSYEPLAENKPLHMVPQNSQHQSHHQPQPQEVKVQVVSPGKFSISTSNVKRPAGPGVPSVPCPHCPKLFMRSYNMRVHIDRVHNKSKPWQCQYCVKAFATTSDLKQHLASHGMGKIHKCEDCGREFSNRDSAILHRKQHNNERTHFCPECNKGFFKASCLQRHVRSHTGEKPYSCEHCGRVFSQVTTMKNHKKACKYAAQDVQPTDRAQVQSVEQAA